MTFKSGIFFVLTAVTLLGARASFAGVARCQTIPKSPGAPAPKGYVTVEVAGDKVANVTLFEAGRAPVVLFSVNPPVRMGHNVFSCYPNDNMVSPTYGADVFSLCGGEGLVGQMTLEINAAPNHPGFVNYMMDLPKRGIVEGEFGLSNCQ